jgi:hypothetical protein
MLNQLLVLGKCIHQIQGCSLRRDEVLLIKKLGYDGWKQLKDTGRRWIAEIVFFSLKRVLGRSPFKEIQSTKSRSRTECNVIQ